MDFHEWRPTDSKPGGIWALKGGLMRLWKNLGDQVIKGYTLMRLKAARKWSRWS